MRIDGNAVTAQARARVEGHEAEGFGGGRVDDLPHVQAQSVAHERDLVHQRDVHAAEGVLEKLDHLGALGRRDLDDGVNGLPVEGRGHVSARGRDPAHDFRRVPRVETGVARIHPLGGESEVEIPAHLEAGGLETGADDLLRGPRIGRAFQHHQHVRVNLRRDGAHRGNDVGDVGIPRFPEGRGDADDDGVAASQGRDVRGRTKATRLHVRGEYGIGNVLNIRLGPVHPVHLRGVGVDARQLETGPREFAGQRKPHVPQPDDSHVRRGRVDLLLQVHVALPAQGLWVSGADWGSGRWRLPFF